MADAFSLKTLAFILVFLGGGIVFRPRLRDDAISMRIILYWVVAAIVLFAIEMAIVRFLLLGIAMLVLAPVHHARRAVFFICTVLAVPARVTIVLDAPGVNYLLILDHLMLQSILVLAPMLFTSLPGRESLLRVRMSLSDIVIVVLAFSTAILSTRGAEYSPTNLMRHFVEHTLEIIIPYFVVSRCLTSKEAFADLLKGALAVGILLTSIGVLSLLHNWNPYTLTFDAKFAGAAFRSGVVKVAATLTPAFMGVAMFATIVMLWRSRKDITTPPLFLYGWMVFAFGILIVSQSRGGWLAALLGVAIIMMLAIRSVALRYSLIGLGAAGVLGVFVLLSGSDYAVIDPYGTFDYREEILRAGLQQVRDAPMFGITNYNNSPYFDDLVQGQGIVDIVNTYLQYALEYGLFGLGLYLYLFARTGMVFMRGSDRLRAVEHSELRATGVGLTAIFGAMLIMIFTTSTVSWNEAYMMMLLAMGTAYRQLTRDIVLSSQTHGGGENDTSLNDDANQQDTAPAKRPFVIDVRPGPKGWNT